MWPSSQLTASLTHSPSGILGMGHHLLAVRVVARDGFAGLVAEETDQPLPRNDTDDLVRLVHHGDTVRQAGTDRAELRERGVGRGGFTAAAGAAARDGGV